MPDDPAVAAAQRAMPMFSSAAPHRSMIDAAREALAPIRDRLDQLAEETRTLSGLGNWVDYHESFARAISDLSPLVYRKDELA